MKSECKHRNVGLLLAGIITLVVLLDHVTDQGNLGAIVRSAEVVGAAGVVIAKARAAGVGVAMGSANDEAKEAADYVTTDLLDDGIWNACRHFALI